jgi:hypothetical protein
MTFQAIEKIGYPLIIFGAVLAIWAFFRKSTNAALTYVSGNGIDPGRWSEHAAGAVNAYIAEIPDYALNPGYIASAIRHPFANTSAAQSDGTPASTAVPSYITYNTPSLMPPETGNGHAHGGCGCGGGCGCEPKCKSDCQSNVRYSDGRGMCMSNDQKIPEPWPTRYFGIAVA